MKSIQFFYILAAMLIGFTAALPAASAEAAVDKVVTEATGPSSNYLICNNW